MPAIIGNQQPLRSVADAYFHDAYPGYRLVDYRGNSGNETLYLQLQPTGLAVCPHCGNTCKAHATLERRLRCAPRDGFSRVFIDMPIRRVRCEQCGCRAMEAIPWVEKLSRLTNKLVAAVQSTLRGGATISAVAKQFHLDWSTVKRLDKTQLQNVLRDADLHGVTHLIMDEFSIQKGHKYATSIMDADTHRIIWIGKGKRGVDVKPFFEMLQQKGYANQIESVAMDMNACFPSLVREYLPRATVVYDSFHCLQMLTRDVLVKAKIHCQQQAEKRYAQDNNALRQAKALLTSSQWVLVKPLDRLEADDQQKLVELRANNQLLADLYPIADMLRAIWKEKDKNEAARLLGALHHLGLAIARAHQFTPIRSFVQTLKRRMDGIIQAGKFGYSSCPLEGAHNKIKVLKRTAYGFRDFEYFKLKIMSILSGKRFNPWLSLTPACAVTKTGIRKCCFHTIS